MALSLDDVESWLPSEFLTKQELPLMGKHSLNQNEFRAQFKPGLSFPTEFPYEFDTFGTSSSALSSPVESVLGSTETESSDEDDFLVGLTRRLTQQLAVKPESKWVMVGSPKSTLSGIGNWSFSCNGSPNGVLSPPTTPFGAKNNAWDLIYDAASQVARLKVSSNYQERGLLGPARSQNLVTAVSNQDTGHYYSHQSFGHDVSRLSQHHHLVRQEQLLKHQCSSVWGRQHVKAGWQGQALAQPQQEQIQSRGRSIGYENSKCVRPLGLPQSAWPPLEVQPNQQQQHHQHAQNSNSGIRTVFLGGSGVKRGCAGTGVFLPRRYGNPSDCKKKSSCSKVLLPAKVVQALNLDFDDMNVNGHSQPRFNSTFPSDYDALLARRNALLAQQKRGLRSESVMNHEVRLPQEWTY